MSGYEIDPAAEIILCITSGNLQDAMFVIRCLVLQMAAMITRSQHWQTRIHRDALESYITYRQPGFGRTHDSTRDV